MDASPELKEAMEHHQKGDLDDAIKLYHDIVAKNSNDKRVYVNLAALLRNKGKPEAAAKIINRGLKNADAKSPILLNTMGNCLRDLGRYSEAINLYRRAIKHQPGYYDPQISIVGTLYEAGYKILSDRCLYELFKFYGPTRKGILNQIIIREVENSNIKNRPINPRLELILNQIDALSTELEPKLPIHWYLTAQLCSDAGKVNEAIKYYKKAKMASQRISLDEAYCDSLKKKAQELHTISSWNFACNLLRQGEMNWGWKLYDYGLTTPCEGAQRWQRALFKPFSFSKVPLWKGESLKNKSILLLGEQGIGDTMAFISLTKDIIKEARHVSFIVPHRLYEIYKRTLTSCSIYRDTDFKKKPEDPEKFDYQSPVGSIVQYKYKDLESFKGNNLILKSDKKITPTLRTKYLNGQTNTPIIGISWQGGGKKERIDDKSIKLDYLIKCLSNYNLKIVSLQYGDDSKVVKNASEKHKVDFIDDPDIQATNDMNSWLNQVDSCDGIISIANTTIHGAGGLCKPTLCLLGSKSDWRWLKDRKEKWSYWYPTVEIAWQSTDGDNWNDAIKYIPKWLEKNHFV